MITDKEQSARRLLAMAAEVKACRLAIRTKRPVYAFMGRHGWQFDFSPPTLEQAWHVATPDGAWLLMKRKPNV